MVKSKSGAVTLECGVLREIFASLAIVITFFTLTVERSPLKMLATLFNFAAGAQ